MFGSSIFSESSEKYNLFEQLRSAVESDNINDASALLAQGINPNYQSTIVKVQPIMLAVKSPEMILLLLQHGADAHTDRLFMTKPLWKHYYEANRFDLIAALVNYKTCPIPHMQINKALIALIRSSGKECLSKDFKWDSHKGNAILSLIHASTNLREKASSGTLDPLSYATNQTNDILVKLMLNTNFILYEDLKRENKHSDYFHNKKKLPEPAYSSSLKMWQFLRFLSNDNGNAYSLPLDIIELITFTSLMTTCFRIDLFKKYHQENIELSTKMHNFGVLDSICPTDEQRYQYEKAENFWLKNQYLTPSSFFRKANNQALLNNGNTKFVLSLLDTHDMTPENVNLVSDLYKKLSWEENLQKMFNSNYSDELTNTIKEKLANCKSGVR